MTHTAESRFETAKTRRGDIRQMCKIENIDEGQWLMMNLIEKVNGINTLTSEVRGKTRENN